VATASLIKGIPGITDLQVILHTPLAKHFFFKKYCLFNGEVTNSRDGQM
jgi:hypothetical protein